MEFLALFSIFGLVVLLRLRWKIPVELLPLVATTAVVIALYLFAFAGVLWFGAGLIFAVGIGALPIVTLLDRSGLRRVLGELRVPPIYIFFGGAIAYRLFFSGIQFYSWDTFAHWGYATQELLYFDAFDRSTSNNLEADYPPGINLFHYFMVFLSQNTEDRIYFANYLLLASPLVILLGGLRNRQIGGAVLLVALGYFFTSTFGVSFRDIPPDHTLGLLFGGAVLYFLRIGGAKTPAPSLLLWGLPAIAMLPLIKESGIYFAMVAAAIAALDLVLRGRVVAGWRSVRNLSMIALIFIAPLATWTTWHSYVSSSVDKKTFAVDRNTAAVAWDAIVAGERNAVRQKTIESFVDALTQRTIGQAMTGAVLNRLHWQFTGKWKSGDPFPDDKLIPERPVPLAALAAIFVVLAGGVLVLTQDARQRWRFAVVCGLLTAGGCGYLLLLLVLYLSAFGAGVEAQEVRYFGRYVGTYVLGTGLIVFWFIAGLMAQPAPEKVARAALVMCLVGTVLVASRMSVSILLGITPEHRETRQMIKARTAYAKSKADDAARVFVVWQVTSGYEHRILHYELLPRFTNRSCWSFAPQGAALGCAADTVSWARTLKDYDYVLLAKTDRYFRSRFGSLFDPGDLSAGKYLYEVVGKKDGKIGLRGL